MSKSEYRLYWYPVAKCGKIVCFRNGISTGAKAPAKRRSNDEVAAFNERMSQSISRTKSRIFEIAACNPFEWFFTGTLNPEWRDVTDLADFRKRLTQYMRDVRKASGCSVMYLLVPEQHKSGSWHIHGLLGGIPSKDVRKFTLDEHLPYRILNRIKRHDDVYDWSGFSKRFGFTTLTPIRSPSRCCRYVTKYICKDMYKLNVCNGQHLYYASKGLRRAAVLDTPFPLNYASWDFENDYVKIKDFDAKDSGYIQYLESHGISTNC